jgi:hypothetical protein
MQHRITSESQINEERFDDEVIANPCGDLMKYVYYENHPDASSNENQAQSTIAQCLSSQSALYQRSTFNVGVNRTLRQC